MMYDNESSWNPHARDTLTILIRPLKNKSERSEDNRNAECFVRAILKDETFLPDCYFPSVRAFLMYALDNQWRERYNCVPVFLEHPDDLIPRREEP